MNASGEQPDRAETKQRRCEANRLKTIALLKHEPVGNFPHIAVKGKDNHSTRVVRMHMWHCLETRQDSREQIRTRKTGWREKGEALFLALPTGVEIEVGAPLGFMVTWVTSEMLEGELPCVKGKEMAVLCEKVHQCFFCAAAREEKSLYKEAKAKQMDGPDSWTP